MDITIYLALGAFAGLIAGLLGAGGGSILVPGLVFVFGWQGVAPAEAVHMAIATSLATMVFTAIASVHAHHQRGAVLWHVFRAMLPGIAAGAVTGAVLAHYVPDSLLGRLFGGAMLLIAAKTGLGGNPSPHRELPRRGALALVGSGIGTLSAMLGIGGASLTVPLLLWCNTRPAQAVATAAAVGLPIALFGTLCFMLTGPDAAHAPAWSLGYVYLPAALGIVVASMVCAPLGARLAHVLPGPALKRIFALLLLAVGLIMVIG